MLRRWLSTALSILLFSCFYNSLARREANQAATLMLSNAFGGQCSGIILTQDGYVLTAGHCVPENLEIIAVYDGDRRGLAQVIAVSRDKDLALLKVDDWSFSSVAVLHNGRRLQSGDTVYNSGFPFGMSGGLPQLFGVGHIMNPEATFQNHPGRQFVLVDLETGRPGASGSGVYDVETGGLIGLVVSANVYSEHNTDRMTVVLLVPVTVIRQFLLSNGLRIPTSVEENLWGRIPSEVRIGSTAPAKRI